MAHYLLVQTLSDKSLTEFLLISSEPSIKFELRFKDATATFEIDPNSDKGKTPNIEILGTQNNIKLQQDLLKYVSENSENNVLFKLCQIFKDSVDE